VNAIRIAVGKWRGVVGVGRGWAVSPQHSRMIAAKKKNAQKVHRAQVWHGGFDAVPIPG